MSEDITCATCPYYLGLSEELKNILSSMLGSIKVDVCFYEPGKMLDTIPERPGCYHHPRRRANEPPKTL